MISETNRLASYSMKAKIFSSYFGKPDEYNSQANDLEEKTVMDLTYSTNSNNNNNDNHRRDEDEDMRDSYAADPRDDHSALQVMPHHGLLATLPPGPSNYRTVIQHIPTGNLHHPASGMITVLPEHHPTGSGVGTVLSRHQPSPSSVHSLDSPHPSASSSPSLHSDSTYKNYNDEGAGSSGIGSMVTSSSSSRKKKKQPQPIPEECKDDAYWERRKRNNESAKRSREIRRMKEHHTSIRVVFLEQENLQLRTEVNMLREEVEKLRNLLCSKGSSNNGAAS